MKDKELKNPPPSEETQINTTRKQHPQDPGVHAKMPHERDQSVGEVNPEPSPPIEQAHQDLKDGLVDTDERAADGRPQGSKKPTA
ncbi:hypothetical protein ACQYWY_01400 [Comamonas sediminis]|uniref:hypothetical protein n=1 Tax=Comamonas TaxID=283 RepID=UPI003D0ECF14